LYEQASDDRQISFAFCTPQPSVNVSMILLCQLEILFFNSLIKRWNNYSNIEMSTFPYIHTEIVAEQRSKFIGCIGLNIQFW